MSASGRFLPVAIVSFVSFSAFGNVSYGSIAAHPNGYNRSIVVIISRFSPPMIRQMRSIEMVLIILFGGNNPEVVDNVRPRPVPAMLGRSAPDIGPIHGEPTAGLRLCPAEDAELLMDFDDIAQTHANGEQ